MSLGDSWGERLRVQWEMRAPAAPVQVAWPPHMGGAEGVGCALGNDCQCS